MLIANWLNLKSHTTHFNLFDRNHPMPRDFEAFAKEAYQLNSVGFTAISQIAMKCAEIKLKLFKRSGKTKTEILDHPILTLLKKPNLLQGYNDFVISWVSYYKLTGNVFVLGDMFNDEIPAEITILPPEEMDIKGMTSGLPTMYTWQPGSKKHLFPFSRVNGFSEVKHTKTFNPTDKFWGMSPIEACAYGIDQHNKSNLWNISLLDNKCVPSGMISSEKPMTDQQGTETRKQLDEKIAGHLNAGRPIINDGNSSWTPFSFTPEEMSWLDGKNVSAKDIALCLNYPPMLLGIKGDSSFNNHEAAKLSLVENGCIPVMKVLATAFNRWITVRHDENLFLEIDASGVEEIIKKKKEEWAETDKITFLSVNEKRELSGFETRKKEIENVNDAILVGTAVVPIDDLQTFGADDVDENESELLNDKDPKKPKPKDPKKEMQIKAFNLHSKRAKRLFHRQVLRQRKALEIRLAVQVKSILDKQVAAIASGLKGVTINDGPEARGLISSIIDGTSEALEKTLARNYRIILNTFGGNIFKSLKQYEAYETKSPEIRFADFVNSYIQNHAGENVNIINATTKRALIEALQELLEQPIEDGAEAFNETVIAAELSKRIKEISRPRARLIARTETSIASNEGTRAAVRSLGLPKVFKEWLDADDDRVRDGSSKSIDDKLYHDECSCKARTADHTSNRGKLIDFEEKFKVPGSKSPVQMTGPGDPSAPVEQLANCRCVLAFSTGGA